MGTLRHREVQGQLVPCQRRVKGGTQAAWLAAGRRVDLRVGEPMELSALGATEGGEGEELGPEAEKGQGGPGLRVPRLFAGLHEISEASALCQLTLLPTRSDGWGEWVCKYTG